MSRVRCVPRWRRRARARKRAAGDGPLHLRARDRPSSEDELLKRVFADRIVLEHLPEFVCLFDQNKKILYLSRTVPNWNVADLLGMSALDLIAPEHCDRYLEAFERAWSLCEPQTVEYTSRSGHHWQTRLVPIRRDGKVEYMLATSLDMTDRVLAQQALRERDSRLRHAIAVVGMGTWTRNWDTGAVTVDDALGVILGVESKTAPTTFDDLIAFLHPDDRQPVLAAAAELRQDRPYVDMEFRFVRPTGEVRHVLARASVQRDEQGQAFGTLGAVFDITDRKRLEEQLSQRRKMEAIGELTAGIAHNFNNVLSIIMSNLELCIADAPPTTTARLYDIQLAARRAADLVRQLMLFARRDAGGRKGIIDPTATLRRIAAICQTTFDRKIQIDVELAPGSLQVRADPGQLEQVLLNICLNARDALMGADTREPRIALAADRTTEGAVRIRVSDNGPGMDEQTRARVFEPFFTTKGIGRGTGLGLANAYAIIGDHGGRIACESRPGHGARFEIILPFASELPQTASPAAVSRANAPLAQVGHETVLVVDDDDLVRRATRAVLTRYGYRVVEASDGRDALARFESHQATIDLVLLDRSMPGLSGEQVLSRLRELAPHLPIVLLSGQAFEPDSAARADAALIKPVQSDQLLSVIRRVLDDKQERGQAVGLE